MKKLNILLLATLFCVVSAHAQTFTVDEISYSVTKQPNEESLGEVQVTGGEIKEEIVIPETVTYDDVTYIVTSIGNGAFYGRRDRGNYTKRYVIPGTVRTIGSNAFYDNYYLEEVEFNEGLISIDAGAFEYNFALKEIRIPSTVATIAENVFHTNQQNLAPIYCLAETPPSIQPNTFEGRTDAILHVVKTDAEAYTEAENWKVFSEIVGDILYRQRCYSPVFTFDNGILTMSCKTEGAAIYYTTDGTVPDESAIRYTSPISYNTNQIIRALAISEGMEKSTVRDYYNREQVEKITDEQGLYYTLEQANDGSFYYSVTGHSDEMNTEIVILNNLHDCPVRTIENNVFSGCTDLLSVTIPDGVTSIGVKAFQNCSNLSIVTLGNQLVEIGDYAFYGCTSLSSVTIPSSAATIGARAFEECSNLTSLILGDQLTTIGDYAFTRCTSLLSITIPNSVNSIGEFAFSKCSGLTSVKLSNSLTSLKAATFYDCSSLTNITLPNSLTCIEDAADNYRDGEGHGSGRKGEYGVFTGCSSLATITIPNSVTSTGEYNQEIKGETNVEIIPVIA